MRCSALLGDCGGSDHDYGSVIESDRRRRQSFAVGFFGSGVGPVVIPVLQVAAGPGWGIRRVCRRRGF
ncbi:hypothetical protein I546_7274 [Mycobacterium kansasii 732]|nr:hypothetical protein I546_7274 [Mycobacterium kansasii 732]